MTTSKKSTSNFWKKRCFGVRITTPNCLVYGELGRYPLIVNIKCRMLCFWSKLVLSENFQIKYIISHIICKKMVRTIDFIKKTFDEIGLSFIFTNLLEINPNWIKVHAKLILCDQFVQRLLIRLEATFILFSNKNFVWNIPY